MHAHKCKTKNEHHYFPALVNWSVLENNSPDFWVRVLRVDQGQWSYRRSVFYFPGLGTCPVREFNSRPECQTHTVLEAMPRSQGFSNETSGLSAGRLPIADARHRFAAGSGRRTAKKKNSGNKHLSEQASRAKKQPKRQSQTKSLFNFPALGRRPVVEINSCQNPTARLA